jgi:hypothetical protein
MSIANTILAQLGGRRFIAMTGARNLTSHGDGLAFRLPSNLTRCNAVRITLTAADDYRVEGFAVRGRTVRPLHVHHGIYDSNLRAAFEALTGLRASL